MTPNDPYYSLQWHFALLGDIETIWEEFDGSGVKVGIFDDGVERNHEDLNDNYLVVSNFYDSDGVPNAGTDGHGTSVAGIIAAENNTTGGVGVAWGSFITGIDFLNDDESLFFSRNFAVANHSWGYPAAFLEARDIGDGNYTFSREVRAFERATEVGRGDLGTIHVKAAGNGYLSAQGEGLNNLHTVITVGATDRFGNVTDYSNQGHSLLVSAGAAAYTTDRSGVNGYNRNDEPGIHPNYTGQFDGTSAATPVVSGVVALMLQANPDLGWRDVQNILAISAAHTGSRYGGSKSGYENYAWDSTATGSWNGGGMTFNPAYGFGRVDAFAAVRMAEIWSLMNPTAAQSANERTQTFGSSSYAEYFDHSEAAVRGIYVRNSITIEHIYLTVDWEHEDVYDVRITLIAPDGTESVVFDRDWVLSYDNDWTFALTNYLGRSSQGQWFVKIEDLEAGTSGYLNDFQIEFRGSEKTTDTQWHFTDDFRMLAAVEGQRASIRDVDGGSDWLNFAAITGNLAITLSVGTDLVVDGIVWASLSFGQIENAVGGDGNDVIIGNDAANHLVGARGDDVLKGGVGTDSLNGGQGDDYLYGDDFEVGHAYGTSAQVFRLFQATLGRTPGTTGHMDWTEALVSGEMTLLEVISGFVNSAEFRASYSGLSNTEFVELLYENVLGRATDAGATGWITALDDNTLTREEVVMGFSESAEFEIKTREDAAAFIESRSADLWMDEIFRLYQATFDRLPDLGGFGTWMNQLSNGRDYLDVVQSFIGAPEFTLTYGATDNGEFVTLLFQNVLGRAPGAAGYDYWVGELDSGALTRAEVVRGFAESAEFIRNTNGDMIDFIRTQIEGGDVLTAGGGTDSLIGGTGSDTFVFHSRDSGTVTIHDLEAWDYLDFQNFGYADHTGVLANTVQDGDDAVFSDYGFTVIFKDTDLSMLTETLFTGELAA